MTRVYLFSCLLAIAVAVPFDLKIIKEGNVVAESSGDVQPTPKVRRQTEVTCTKEYKAITGHTMCLNDNPDVTSRGVSQQEKEDIVKLHNILRGAVEPSATDLMKIVWDEKLATVADKWARQCVVGHDKVKEIPDYGLSIGQNVAGGYKNWQTAIMEWYNEVSMYRYGEDTALYLGKGGWRKIGHYTQIVHNGTFLVGCGFATCPNSLYGRFYVCNYGSGQSNIRRPYTRGQRCGACPSTCKQGLCDCGGKTCLNGGQMNKNTCSCSCPKLYSGPTCEKLNCPAEDVFHCGRSLTTPDCQKFYNVPHLCPYMCGICGSPAMPTKTSHTGVSTTRVEFTSAHGCKYSGKRSPPAECRKYGDQGNDMRVCGSMGGQVTCATCEEFYNIKTDYCPVMCGICDAPCNGKKCQHSGRLNTSTCQCECKAPYEGSTCQTAKCPTSDPFHCQVYRKSYCSQYINVPSECPFLCNIC